jgi:hypothetical protein
MSFGRIDTPGQLPKVLHSQDGVQQSKSSRLDPDWHED